jgi:type III secretion protein O
LREAVAQIVDVKQRREDRAQEAVRASRVTLEDAARRLGRAKEELERYARWRPGEEARLWDGLMGRLVKLDDIDALKAEIGLLRGKEHLLTERVDEAERGRQAAHKVLQEAQAAHDAALRARQKFEELADILDTEWRQELERREELELEELAGMRVADVEERLE